MSSRDDILAQIRKNPRVSLLWFDPARKGYVKFISTVVTGARTTIALGLPETSRTSCGSKCAACSSDTSLPCIRWRSGQNSVARPPAGKYIPASPGFPDIADEHAG